MKHIPDELTYGYDALEPYIDQATMEVHHDKHYVGYVKKLNAALEGNDDLMTKTAEEILVDLASIPEDIKTAVINNGGGVANHAMFWKILGERIELSGEIAEAIDAKFDSFTAFKEQFSDASAKLFGSGWCWLVVAGGELEIVTTANQDSPLSEGKTPVLLLDLWEHAYYLKYQNRRPEYIEAFFNVINWGHVNEYYKEAIK